MKARPILFSGPMVRALLDGRKTQTRRILKQPKRKDGCKLLPEFLQQIGVGAACPYGQPGDLLWVREGHRVMIRPENATDGIGRAWYRLDDGEQNNIRWQASIHMPRWASRLTLVLTGVRVERLQDVSDEDCFAEGIDPETDETYLAAEHFKLGGISVRGGTPERCAYAFLWESINGPGSWDANPWLWLLEFKVHRANVDDLMKARAA